MAVDKEIARLLKILVDSEDVGFPEAEARLRALTLEIVVGNDTNSPAAHAAVLTAVSTGRRTFLGGVRVVGNIGQPVITALPIVGQTLGDVCAAIGANGFEASPTFTIVIGNGAEIIDGPRVAAWWDGWQAGVRQVTGDVLVGDSTNPLAGIAAGAQAVGCGFDSARGRLARLPADINLWGLSAPPPFTEVFLPGAIWIVGLGNLGQALAWALASLPYASPDEVELVLHDFDRVSDENWGTSVLVPDGSYGGLKTKLVERWLEPGAFRVRRVDRRLLPTDRLVEGEPRLAFSGLDKIAARRDMAPLGFEVIVDAGLGRTSSDFDKFRVTVFHKDRPIDIYFAGMPDPQPIPTPDNPAYQALAEKDPCGAAEIAGASVAVPFVSAITAAVAVARMIALVSGQPFIPAISRRTSESWARELPAPEKVACPGLVHAGRPREGRRRQLARDLATISHDADPRG